jgi:phage gp46-like protein
MASTIDQGEFSRDMATGDYVVGTDGKPVLDTSLAPPLRVRLRCHRTKWLYAPNSQYGSDFFKYNRRKSTVFIDSLGQNIAKKAIQPMIDDGRADNVDVSTQSTRRGGVALGIALTDTQQNKPVAVTVPIGG